MLDVLWLIPAFPLAGFLVILLLGRRLGEPLAGWVATLMVAASFVVSVGVYIDMLGMSAEERSHVDVIFSWIPVGALQVDLALLADPLSITMALFVTGIGALIHLYSIGYMHGDPKFSKFFLYLNLFVASMLVLVLGDNLLMTFLGWEGVGTCSYLLISFWFTNPANATAGKKAFVTNRIGDWGFMLTMFLTFVTLGSLSYADLLSASAAGDIAAVTATGIALLLFVGAVGKSAQIPLFVWLPDAMAGPTPVSALIHAATMVTAGVYLMFRISPVIGASYDWVPTLIAWIGVLTALVAATIAVAQNDIKKVLAYSTVSQLGFMFFAIGTGAYVAAMFHVITHAFFKALLFLGSGSVIHGMHDEQDMRKMGGLFRFMPVTAVTFIIGWLSIAGIPPFSGFWSKDEILIYAWQDSKAIWLLGSIAALLTAFYMSRQVFMVFFGERHWETADHADEAAAADGEGEAVEGEPAEAAHVDTDHGDDADAHAGGVTPHESPALMTIPLVVLAVAALFSGGLNLPFTPDWHYLEHWLEPSLFGNEAHLELGAGTKWAIALFSTLLSVVGIAIAVFIYLLRRVDPAKVELRPFAEGWWIDSTFGRIVGGPGRQLFEWVAWFDKNIIDGAVNGVASGVRAGGTALRTAQTGYVRTYALAIGVGALFVGVWFLTRASF